jgi:hypothetical protein
MPTPKPSPTRPLEGSVALVGTRPRVSLTERAAAVADLSITLTGGTGRTAVPMTFAISLNVPLSGRAQLIDEATGTLIAESTRSGSQIVFRDVAVVPPGTQSRTFRITNVRGNASSIGVSGSGLPNQIVAFVSVAAPLRIAVSGSQQNVATLQRQ